ncbi:hypothetical protein OGM63_17035 [Plectonema radiosum NIES-515]|uniref:Uncharacterized protein n=1 Tax=Plectonema radiosum NIES-515 TaxID=2986073 RepID=A0ABT3B1F6_9CYAN|nr:hypothetical protein [Plectonema radiosum]MCV3215196.1 hypothetical protein [Plectonema radiosum NIES-515]
MTIISSPTETEATCRLLRSPISLGEGILNPLIEDKEVFLTNWY